MGTIEKKNTHVHSVWRAVFVVQNLNIKPRCLKLARGVGTKPHTRQLTVSVIDSTNYWQIIEE